MEQGRPTAEEGIAPNLTPLVLESRYAGPLPAPASFGAYEAVLPGAAERLVRMAEKDQDADIRERAYALETERIEVRATARATLVAAACLAGLPYALIVLAAATALTGRSPAISALTLIAATATALPQLVRALRG